LETQHPKVGTPVVMPPVDEIAPYLVAYQRRWGGDVRIEVFTASLDGIIAMLKDLCDAWNGMGYVYYPNPAGMLQLAYMHGGIEDLFVD
jgi:hypothetical protein